MVEQFRSLPPPLLTCEPMLAETFHLVSRLRDGSRRFFELLGTGAVSAEFELMTERAALARLARKYSNFPMSLADACLVQMSEINTDSTVFTLDHQFRIYRKHGRQLIPTIMPPGQ
ncbi:MAG: type II toxin-antitoxin system VapC family toxin [Phycisphaerae bacterium]